MTSTSSRARRVARERAAGLRLPLVLAASRLATKRAQTLMPGRVLENVVLEGVAAGRLAHVTGAGAELPLDEHGVIVVLERTKSVSGRKAWRPVDVTINRRRAS